MNVVPFKKPDPVRPRASGLRGLARRASGATRTSLALLGVTLIALAWLGYRMSIELHRPLPVVVHRAGAFADLDCADFASRTQATRFLRRHPGDPHGLDSDGDGAACEWLPLFAFR